MAYGGITQLEYIAILFIDCGYDTAAQRRGWLQGRFKVSHADGLTDTQKGKAIEMLREERNDSISAH